VNILYSGTLPVSTIRTDLKKADALKETGNLLNITPDEVNRKLRNINSQYLRETTSMCSEILWHANFPISVLAMLSALRNI
jgi:CBS-domain-containing membrane protein